MNILFYISEKVTTVLALGVRALNVAFILIDQKIILAKFFLK